MKFFKLFAGAWVCACVCASAQALPPSPDATPGIPAQSTKEAMKTPRVTVDENGNRTVNVGKGNQVSNESGTIDGKKVPNSKKIAAPKSDADEAFWGKGGFWGNGGSAP